MSDKGLAIPCGGDDNNYYMFYCGHGYEHNSYETIAQFAREKFPHLKDLSDQEIKDKHIYWGTESPSFEAMYNGDTFVLFDDADKLPDDKKADAYRCCNLSKSEEKPFFNKRNDGYYVYDWATDYDSGTVIGKIKDGKPEPSADDDGGVNFHEVTHHDSITDCFDYLKATYDEENYAKILARIEADPSLSPKEKNTVKQCATPRGTEFDGMFADDSSKDDKQIDF